jgi:hypothetical protein
MAPAGPVGRREEAADCNDDKGPPAQRNAEQPMGNAVDHGGIAEGVAHEGQVDMDEDLMAIELVDDGKGSWKN